MSFWFPYLQYWLIGWPVLWYLISCVMQIKWHWFPPKRFISQILLHLPQVQLSLESGHTQALSHYRLGIQSHTSNIFYISFQSVIWNVWAASGMQLWITKKCRGTVSISTDLEGMLGILNFLDLSGGLTFNATCLVDNTAKDRHQVCARSWTQWVQIGKNSPYEFPVSILLIAGLLVDRLSDSTGNHLSYAD